ncbi:MAG: TraB/GumN family protein, partial [Sphingomonadales bacterium]
LLDGSGTVFIAVGAAHLAGDDSVQSILERRGVTAERVQ